MTTGIATNLDYASIIQRIANGEYASHIAQELGISPQILSYHLRKIPDWQQALESAHEVRLDSTDKQIEDAINQRDFDLARACEGLLKRREWRAERECPKRWGQQQAAQSHAPVAVQINIGSVAQVETGGGTTVGSE